MSDDKTTYQQQIMFEENDLTSTDKKQQEPLQAIVFDNDNWQAIPDDENDVHQDISESKPRWLWRFILSLFALIVVIETVQFFLHGFSESPIIASLYALLLVALTLIAGSSIFKEFTGLRQLKQREKTQQTAEHSNNFSSTESTVDFCQQISQQLPCDLVTEHEKKWADITHQDHTPEELLALYSKVVLTKVDKKAIAEISKFSSESVVLISLSPVALLDMFIMVWRNLRMIDKIAGLYGLKLGYWSRIKLVKQVFINMVYAGASELVSDFGADMLGAEMLGKFSGRLAQGLGAGLLTARLGLKTIKLCRPIPFEENEPSLKDIRRDIIAKLKSLTVKS